MKTRPWRYLVEFHHHNNTDCPQPPPKPGRGMMKIWGSGDLPLCVECEKLDRSSNTQLEQLGHAVRLEADTSRVEAPMSVEAMEAVEADDTRDPD